MFPLSLALEWVYHFTVQLHFKSIPSVFRQLQFTTDLLKKYIIYLFYRNKKGSVSIALVNFKMFEYVIVCKKIKAVLYITSKEYEILHNTHEFDV